MRPVSDAFLRALRGSHRAATEAYVVTPGQTGVSPTGTEIDIISGDVQFDANASIRATLDLTTSGYKMFPEEATDALAPYGNEIFIRRGIAFGAGSFEWVSQGYYRINSVEQDEAPDGPIAISAQDRMSGIVDGRLVNPIQYAATKTYGEIMEELVQEIYPWATIEWDDSTDTDATGRALLAEEDRYAFLNDLVTSVGKIWFWDYRGILVIKNPPAEDEPVWTVNSGTNGVLLKLQRDLSREGVYNGVVAYGEALDTTTPSRALAFDNNPDSPTYWEGDFGKVPRFYSSPFITSDAQALSAATSLLKKNLGLPYNLGFGVIPNPALEPYDAVEVVYDHARRKEIHVLERITLPLVVTEEMTAQTREQTLVIIGEE